MRRTRNGNRTGNCSTQPGEEALPVAPLIVIAEEQPAIRELLRWMLHLAGYHTTLCVGRQALLTWREQAMLSGDVPVVLLDLSLLCTNEAADFLRHLRARWQDAGGMPPQIIVLTTNAQVQAELGIREHVLQKPFHVRDLLALIQQATLAAYRSENG